MLQQNNNVEIGTEICIATASHSMHLPLVDSCLFYLKIASKKSYCFWYILAL